MKTEAHAYRSVGGGSSSPLARGYLEHFLEEAAFEQDHEG